MLYINMEETGELYFGKQAIQHENSSCQKSKRAAFPEFLHRCIGSGVLHQPVGGHPAFLGAFEWD
jgi:hypothetical protein